MKIFIAGATGAMGKHLLPLAIAGGHEVVATTRSQEKAATLRKAGVEAVVVDGFDGPGVMRAVLAARPEVIIHQLTGLSRMKSLRRFDDEFDLTNQLRTRGTDHLLAAARAAGVRRFVAQSYAGWPYAREGGPVKDEEAPLDPSPPRNMRRTLEALRYLESTTLGARDIEGIALRYGSFYGPGTSISLGGDIVEAVGRRQFPIVGDGAGIWSFVHIADAAAATLAALRRGSRGVYNVVDDEPVPVSTWLPELARVIGAKPPRQVPIWVGRLFTGDVGVSMMTRVRGASNAKARRELGWQPRYATFREGFRTGLSETPAARPAPVAELRVARTA